MQTTFVSPMSYDANQNAVVAGSTSLTYDALGRLVEFGGKPVVYGPSGEKLAVFNGTAYAASIALPGGGEAYYTLGALTSLRRKDWLGSSRLATNWAHAVVSKAAYAPYGETYDTAGTTDLDFTGQTQSSVSTLFDFPAWKYDPNAGRWTVPDPGAWRVVDPGNPQSFNRYAYVRNMSLMLTDPTGEDPGCPTMPGGVCPGGPCGNYSASCEGPPDGLYGQYTSEQQYETAFENQEAVDEAGFDERVANGGWSGPDPIQCQPDVIGAINRIWAQSDNGSSGYEASFYVKGSLAGTYRIYFNPLSTTKNTETFSGIQGDTFAIFHTHPVGMNDASLSDVDIAVADAVSQPWNPLQIFAISSPGLSMYDGKTGG